MLHGQGHYELNTANGMEEEVYYYWIKAVYVTGGKRYVGYNYVASTYYSTPHKWGLDIDLVLAPVE